MTSPTQSYLENADRFTAVVDATSDWSGQSPCPDWTAAEVVDHVVSTQRDFLHKQGVSHQDLPRDASAAWHQHLDGVRTAMAEESFATREFDGYFGRTTVEEQLASFYGFDMLVHRWDLGSAVGVPVAFDEEELDRIEQAMAGFGDMLYSEGVCKPALTPPDDATRQQRLLARLGRKG